MVILAPRRAHPAPKRKKGRPVGRPKSREETPKEGCGRRAELSDAAPQNMNAAHKEGKCNFCRAAITAALSGYAADAGLKVEATRFRCRHSHRKRPFVRANGPSLGRKRPDWAAMAKKCFSETASLVCSCSPRAATQVFPCIGLYCDRGAAPPHDLPRWPLLLEKTVFTRRNLTRVHRCLHST